MASVTQEIERLEEKIEALEKRILNLELILKPNPLILDEEKKED